MPRRRLALVALGLVALAGGCKMKGRADMAGAAYPAGAIGFVGDEPEPTSPGLDTQEYLPIVENEFVAVADDPLSTFGVDVDTASYSNVRRFLSENTLPPAAAVRLEELINYFDYDYPQPDGPHPFAVATELAACPWNGEHQLVRIGLQGKTIAQKEVPPRNLVFLVDVSGSMDMPDKLPLLEHALRLLAKQLRQRDSIAIVVYAGAAGVVLEPTHDPKRVDEALARLQAGGSTNGGEGIQRAYALAREHFVEGGINRVILASDGDFNVGITDLGSLVELIEKERESGVFLTVLGFGRDNLGDATMEQLADKGNGNYAYIDGMREAEKVLLREVDSTLVTIAKDVKIQVEFNPAEVASYRLIGYENRRLEHQDFNDDKKDAGDIGAGHEVTALYEIVPAGADAASGVKKVDELRYQDEGALADAAKSGEMMTVKIRYKLPDGDASELLSVPVLADAQTGKPSADFRFAAAVAEFGLLLRDSKHKGDASWAATIALANGARAQDKHGDRDEFLALVRKAARLKGNDQPLERAR